MLLWLGFFEEMFYNEKIKASATVVAGVSLQLLCRTFVFCTSLTVVNKSRGFLCFGSTPSCSHQGSPSDSLKGSLQSPRPQTFPARLHGRAQQLLVLPPEVRTLLVKSAVLQRSFFKRV